MDQFFTDEFWQKVYERSSSWVIETVPALLLIFVLLFISLALYRFLVGKIKKIILKRTQASHHESKDEKEKRVNTLINILRQAGGIVIWIIFILILLREVNLDIGPILASAGIVGLAVGFGAQELVRDFISGFFMLLENQVRAGDVAVINGQGGLVEEIALRTITLRDFSGVVHIFQNGKINTLANMTKDWSASVFDVGVAYKENTDRVKEVMMKVGNEMNRDDAFKDLINEPLEIFGVDAWGDSAVVIKARFKTKPGKQWTVGREYKGRLKKAFDQEGIEIPFPHRTIYWGDEINPLKLKMDNQEKQADKEKEKE
ncbi:small-conductance mechanosensitive channel [Catalinimonas alkaloidigena]|uniref:mechanosensitive ion channel family protein n=1 Tax=Catalinimonas alkaloidigena TaxID=1075417 RepID=UPI0024075FCC|nr:mechanosensitive ion channel family protein [Catalinimonas alkaloidigena]MDF9796670.1 small-conductance mechanosensitive channel [Catalinimonas alkaloidigena]